MKRFSILFSVVLLFATMIYLSSCEKDEVSPQSHFRAPGRDLPPGVTYLPGADKPTEGEVWVQDLLDHGIEVKFSHDSTVWTAVMPVGYSGPVIGMRGDPPGPIATTNCLYDSDGLDVEQHGGCSKATTWKLDVVYSSGSIASGKFFTFSPRIVWGENANEVPAGAQALTDSIVSGIIQVGAPIGTNLGVCDIVIAYPIGSDHHYLLDVFANNVPTGISMSMQSWWEQSCSGAAVVTPEKKFRPYNCYEWGEACTGYSTGQDYGGGN